MDFHLTIQGVSLLIALVSNIIIFAFLAGKVIAQLGNINLALARIDRELEKRDIAMARVWERLDEVRDMIPIIKN